MQFPMTIPLLLLLFCYGKGHSLKGSHLTAAKSFEHQHGTSQDDGMDYDDNNDDGHDDKMMGGNDNKDTEVNSEDNEDDVPQAEANLGKNYFQGDMLTTNDQIGKINKLLYHDSSESNSNQPQLRALIKDVRRTWKNGIIPYIVEDNLDNYAKGIVKGAIGHWQTKTCLRFNKRKNEKDYVRFEGSDGCASYVGRIGGKQSIVVGNKRHRCRLGNIIHEIGHTVGFFHEQSRPDRNKFVKIAWKNVLKRYRVNFVKFSSSVIDSKDVGYDYGSIMHYPRKIFGKKRKEPTVIPTDYKAQIGQRVALSDKDVLQARKLYCSG